MKVILGLITFAALSPLALAGQQAPQRGQTKSPNPNQSQSAPNSGRSTKGSSGQAGQQGGNGSLAIDSGTHVSARLLTALDAKKAHPGQRVVAKVTQNVKQDGRVVIRKNSELVGHVVSAQASGKGQAGSNLAVAFDRLVQGSSSTALNTVVTSVVSVPSAASPMPMDMGEPAMGEPMGAPMTGGSPARRSGGGGSATGTVGAVGGLGSTVGSTVGGVGAGAGSTVGTATASTIGTAGQSGHNMGGMAGNPIILSNTVSNTLGATGNASAGASQPMGGANLGSMASATNQTAANSVFSRRNGNVQLQSGTQLQFEVVGNAHAGNASRH